MEIKETKQFIELVYSAINAYEEDKLTKEELEKILEINFETGEFKGPSWEMIDYEKSQILIRLNNRAFVVTADKEQLISDEVLRKQVFGVERK